MSIFQLWLNTKTKSVWIYIVFVSPPASCTSVKKQTLIRSAALGFCWWACCREAEATFDGYVSQFSPAMHHQVGIVPLVYKVIPYFKASNWRICLLFSFCRLTKSYVAPVQQRALSGADAVNALRPFYFAVHPDFFAQYPKERVGVDPRQLSEYEFRMKGTLVLRSLVSC